MNKEENILNLFYQIWHKCQRNVPGWRINISKMLCILTLDWYLFSFLTLSLLWAEIFQKIFNIIYKIMGHFQITFSGRFIDSQKLYYFFNFFLEKNIIWITYIQYSVSIIRFPTVDGSSNTTAATCTCWINWLLFVPLTTKKIHASVTHLRMLLFVSNFYMFLFCDTFLPQSTANNKERSILLYTDEHIYRLPFMCQITTINTHWLH